MAGGVRMSEDEVRAIVNRIQRVSGRNPIASTTSKKLEQLVAAPPTTKKGRPKSGPSELELIFAKQITVLDIPPPHREYRFMENRDFRLDYAWPKWKFYVEVNGMVHRIRERFLRDVEKLAMAQIHGWRGLVVAGQDVRSGRAMSWLVTLLEQTTKGKTDD